MNKYYVFVNFFTIFYFLDKVFSSSYNKIMEFKLKTAENVILVPRLANVHFFQFSKGYETQNDKHPFCELLFVCSGELDVLSDRYSGVLGKNELLIHGANSPRSFSCPKNAETALIIIGFECLSDKLAYFAKKARFFKRNGGKTACRDRQGRQKRVRASV